MLIKDRLLSMIKSQLGVDPVEWEKLFNFESRYVFGTRSRPQKTHSNLEEINIGIEVTRVTLPALNGSRVGTKNVRSVPCVI